MKAVLTISNSGLWRSSIDMGSIDNDSFGEEFWNSLTKDQQLDAFCAVVRRIYQAELIDQGTYRWCLYDVFNFGPEAYLPAQVAGYLAIHNHIFDSNHDQRLLEAFCKKQGIAISVDQIKYFLNPIPNSGEQPQ